MIRNYSVPKGTRFTKKWIKLFTAFSYTATDGAQAYKILINNGWFFVFDINVFLRFDHNSKSSSLSGCWGYSTDVQLLRQEYVVRRGYNATLYQIQLGFITRYTSDGGEYIDIYITNLDPESRNANLSFLVKNDTTISAYTGYVVDITETDLEDEDFDKTVYIYEKPGYANEAIRSESKLWPGNQLIFRNIYRTNGELFHFVISYIKPNSGYQDDINFDFYFVIRYVLNESSDYQILSFGSKPFTDPTNWNISAVNVSDDYAFCDLTINVPNNYWMYHLEKCVYLD